MKRPTPQELQAICDLYKKLSQETLCLVFKKYSIPIWLESYDRCLDHAVEDLLDLLARFRHWCIDQRLEVQGKVPSFRGEAFWNNWMSYTTVDAILNTLESFLRCLYKALYADRKMVIDGEECACLEGTKRVPGVDGDKLTLTPLLNGQLVAAYGDPRYIALPAIEGRRGAVDPSKKELKSAVKGSVELRNDQDHGFVILEPFRSAAYRCLLSVFLAVVDYWYDPLQALVGTAPTTTLSARRQTDLTAEAEKYVRETYVEHIEEAVARRKEQLVAEVESMLLEWKEDDKEDDDEEDDNGEEVNDNVVLAEAELHPRDVISENACCCVLGGSGSGKSTMLDRILLEEACNWRENSLSDLAMLPVLIRVSEMRPNKKIFDYLFEAVTSLKRSYDSEELKSAIGNYLQSLVDQGRVLFLFDGLNELQQGMELTPLLDYVRQYPNNHYLFTGRIVEFARVSNHFSECAKYEVAPLNSLLIDQFLAQSNPNGDEHPEWQRAIRDKIDDDADLTKLATNPMHLKMIVEVLSNADAHGISSRGELYMRFFAEVLENENTARDPELRQSIDLREDCVNMLGDLAVHSQIYGRQIERSVVRKCHVCTGGKGPSDLVQLLSRLQILKVDEATQTVSFYHDSFMEFYCAKRLHQRYAEAMVNAAKAPEAEKLLREIVVDSATAFEQHYDMLQMCVDLLGKLVTNKRKASLSFVSDLLALGEMPQLPDAAFMHINRRSAEEKYDVEVRAGEVPPMNPLLPLAARLVARLPLQKELTKSERSGYSVIGKLTARDLVEALVLNYARAYAMSRPTYEEGLPMVRQLFSMFGMLLSERIVERLLDRFWLRFWLVERDLYPTWNMHGIGVPNLVVARLLYREMMLTTTDYEALYELLNRAIEQLPMVKSGRTVKTYSSELFLYKRMLFQSLTEKDRRAFFEQMQQDARLEVRSDAQTLLLYSDNTAYIRQHLQTKLLTGFFTQQLSKLLRRWEQDPQVAELLFSEELIEMMPMMLRRRLVRFFLFRQSYDLAPMADFLWNRKGIYRLAEGEKSKTEFAIAILDLFPLQYIPAEIQQKHFDPSIIDCQYQFSEMKETDGVRYRILSRDFRSFTISIPDLQGDFDKSAWLFRGADDAVLRYEVVRDQMTYERTSTYLLEAVEEHTTLPLEGELMAEGEVEPLPYVAERYLDDSLRIVLTNEIQAYRVYGWYKNQRALQIGEIACRFVQQPSRTLYEPHRTLTLRLQADDPLPMVHGRCLLVGADGVGVLPDCEVRTPYYHSPELFRRVTLSRVDAAQRETQIAIPYTILGWADEKVLRLGTNKVLLRPLEQRKFTLAGLGAGKISRVRKADGAGRVLEVHCPRETVLPQRGKIICVLENGARYGIDYEWQRLAVDEASDARFLHLFQKGQIAWLESSKAHLKGARVLLGDKHDTEGRYAGLLNEIRRMTYIEVEMTNVARDLEMSGTLCVTNNKDVPYSFVDKNNQLQYSVLGFDKQNLLLLTETVHNELEELQCTVGENRFVVKQSAPQTQGFIELTFRSQVAVTLPVCGVVLLYGEGQPQQIPYHFAISNQHSHTLRIVSDEWLTAWKKGNLKQLLHGARCKVKDCYLRFEMGRYMIPNNQLSILTLQSVKRIDYDAVPLEGVVSFFGTDSKQVEKLRIRRGMRSLRNQLTQALCCQANDKTVWVVLPKQPKYADYTRLFLHEAEHPTRFMHILSHVHRAAWVLEGDLPESFGSLPLSGVMYVGEANEAIPFVRGEQKSVRLIQPNVKGLSKEAFMEALAAQQVRFNDRNFALNGVPTPSEAHYELLHVSMDQPLESIKRMTAEGLTFELWSHHPVVNRLREQAESAKSVARQYRLAALPYRWIGRGEILIPRPTDRIDHLWYRLDRFEQPFAVQLAACAQEHYCTLRTVDADGSIHRPNDRGTLYFYVDEACTRPVKVGVPRITPLIDVASPKRYHASICDLLIAELKEVDRFDESFVTFFMAKSRSYLILDRYLQLNNPEQRLMVGVVSYASATLAAVYVPDSNPRLVGRMVVSGDLPKGRELRSGDMVLVEYNHKLTLLPEPHRPSRKLGYLRGLVMTVRNGQQDAYIRPLVSYADSLRHQEAYPKDVDYFYHYGADDYTPSYYDSVWFFPSRNNNVRYKNRPLALRVSYIESAYRQAEIDQITTDQNGFVVLLGHDVLSNVRVSMRMSKEYGDPNSWKWASFHALKVGDRCRYVPRFAIENKRVNYVSYVPSAPPKKWHGGASNRRVKEAETVEPLNDFE